MKLLFVHEHSELTGVSTFNYTLIEALLKKYKDIEIDFYTSGPWSIYLENLEKLLHFSGKIYMNSYPEKEYDQIFFNYITSFEKFKEYKGIKKMFIHGLMNYDYIPKNGMFEKIYVFGERAYNYIRCNSEKILIRNGVNIDRFNYLDNINYRPEKILISDGRNNNFTINLIQSAAKKTNSYVQTLGKDQYNDKLKWDVEEVIKTSDLVFAYGRSAIEAMAMGRPVIIYGINGGDGYLAKNNYKKMMETNLSGWSLRTFPEPMECKKELIEEEILKYSRIDGVINRQIVEEYFDINLYLEKILN